MNGGPTGFSQAVSFFVHCQTQQEVDDFWGKLSAGGRTLQCGWLRDKFGLSWQIVPTILLPMLADKDAARSSRVMRAMMAMTKLDIAALQRAYEGG